jgi:cobalt-zinc-cadmium efflux system protein
MVLALTVAVLLAEVVGAWWSGSLALLADAGHLATDAGALTLALAASFMATRPASNRRTFGWHRAEILAALGNAVVLLAVCGYLAVEGLRRLAQPAPVEGGPMLVFAVVGFLVNVLAAGILHRRQHSSLNMKAAYLEVLGDLLGSLLVVVAAVLVLALGYERADAVASLLIAAVILPRSLMLAKEAVEVLLEGTPAGLDLDEVRGHLLRSPGVLDVHDLHAWSITNGLPSLSVHVTVDDATLHQVGVGALLDRFSACVAEHFEVEHATFQIEPASHRAHEELGEAHP